MNGISYFVILQRILSHMTLLINLTTVLRNEHPFCVYVCVHIIALAVFHKLVKLSPLVRIAFTISFSIADAGYVIQATNIAFNVC